MSTTVADALAAARALGVDRLDAQLLLAHHLQQSRAWLAAHGDATLDEGQAQAFEAGCRRRMAGEPLAYVIGEWTFRGLPLRVTPAVLVPRPETELLVDWALERLDALPAALSPPTVLDLGTGSGAIALAVKHSRPRACVSAVDASLEALELARANAVALKLPVEFSAGDWWSGMVGRCFDLVLANPPYIAAADPHLDALRREPALALTPGGDGLGAIDRIVAGAPTHLNDDGWLLIEHGHDQEAAVCARLAAAGFDAISTRTDLAGLARCSAGRWCG